MRKQIKKLTKIKNKNSLISKVLASYRDKIDIIDFKISRLLIKRYDLVDFIGKYKKDNNMLITNKKREREVIHNVTKNINKSKIKKYIRDIYLKIISESKLIED